MPIPKHLDLYCPDCNIHESRVIGDVIMGFELKCYTCGKEMLIKHLDTPPNKIAEFQNKANTTINLFKDHCEAIGKKTKEIVEHDKTKELLSQARTVASAAADEASNLAKSAVNSRMAKDTAAGAAIGAAIAIPIPVIGPAIGAVIGGGLGFYKNLTRKGDSEPAQLTNQEIDNQKYTLIEKLDELRKKGALSEEEFKAEKAKVLGQNH